MNEANEDPENFPDSTSDAANGGTPIAMVQEKGLDDGNHDNLPDSNSDGGNEATPTEMVQEKGLNDGNHENLPDSNSDGVNGGTPAEMVQENGLDNGNQENLPQDTDEVEEVGEELPEEISTEESERKVKGVKCKILMHLLKTSRMYATELTNQIEEDKKKSSRSNSEGEKPGTSQDKEQVQDEADKKGDQVTATVMKTVEDDDFDFFAKTRITSQGFQVSEYQPVLVEGGVMRDYQLRGLRWMFTMFKNGVNGILADEMGLGKTLEVIALICELIEKGITGPFLIIAPLSTLGNWMEEFRKFAPKVPTLLFHGSKQKRKNLLTTIMNPVDLLGKKIMRVVITSYQVILFEKRPLSKINWMYITVDEGHRMKNHNSLLSRTMRKFDSVGKLLLTGTPLQNNLSELWALLNFIIPEVFNSLDAFKSWLDVQEFEKDGVKFMEENYNINIINTVQQILMPFLLRREKKDVSIILPPKKEILVYCPMTNLQRIFYETTVDRSIERLLRPEKEGETLSEPEPKRANLDEQSSEKSSDNLEKYREMLGLQGTNFADFHLNIQLRNPQVQLRKIVNHPYLIQFPLIPGTTEPKIDEDLVKSSGKLLVVDAMLAKLKTQGHKVVIFSTFKVMLNILEDLACLRNYRFCRLDGSTKPEERPEYILKFNTDPDIFLFLVSMRAGGLGINLTGADTIIIYDSDWNPQINLQSQDRCHRIGQTKPVVIYKLCVPGTIDQRIVERGEAKRKLEKMIIQKGKFKRGGADSGSNLIDLKELKELLTSTDYDRVIGSDNRVFTDEELEALLDRSEMIMDDSVNSEEKLTGEKVFNVINYESEK